MAQTNAYSKFGDHMQAFATHQHSRANEALLSSLPTTCHEAWQIWYCPLPLTHSQNKTKVLTELGHKAAGVGSPYKHLMDFESLFCIRCIFLLKHCGQWKINLVQMSLNLFCYKFCVDVLALIPGSLL